MTTNINKRNELLIWLMILSFLPLILLNIQELINIDYSTNYIYEDVIKVFARLSGFYGGVVLWWSFFLGTRFVVKWVTYDYIWSLKVHKILGMYGVLVALLHPLLILMHKVEDVLYLFIPQFASESQSHTTFGRIAFILLLVVYITSAIVRDRIKYRPWLYIHYLSYPILFFTFLHAYDLGGYLEEYLWVKLYWSALFFSFIALTFYRGLKFINLFKYKFIVEEKSSPADKIDLFKLKPQNGMPKKINVGQFFYLKKVPFGEAHPYSVMKLDDNSLTFGILSVGKFSTKLKDLNIGDALYIDGPYGVFTLQGQNDKPKVIISGGIGITPFYELVPRYSNEHTYMFNCNYTLNHAVEREMLVNKLGDRYFDFISHEQASGLNVYNKFLDTSDLVSLLPNNILNSANYFICGSPNFIKAMRKNLDKIGINKERIFFEDFAL